MQTSEVIKNIRHSLHELAQPLAAVSGLIDLLLLELPPSSPLYGEIKVISDKLEQVLEIVARLREIARSASCSPRDEHPSLSQPLPKGQDLYKS